MCLVSVVLEELVHCFSRTSDKIRIKSGGGKQPKTKHHHTRGEFLQLAKDPVDSGFPCDSFSHHFAGCYCLLEKVSFFSQFKELLLQFVQPTQN